MKVGELSILLNIQPNRRSMRAVEGALGGIRRSAMGLVGYFGARHLGKALVGFNSSIEDSKNQIAGVLALANKTGLADQVGTATKLYDGLRAKAAELPGTTKQYVDMLALLAHPMARAKLSTEQMIDMTTGAMTASTGLGESWQKTARDIREFINFGKMNSVDTFARLMLDDYDSSEGKKKLKAMTVEQRAQLMAARVNQKSMKDLQAAQSASFAGRADKLKDEAQLFMGKVGEPLTAALKESMTAAVKWLETHKDAVKGVADAVGQKLVWAFNKVKDAVLWLVDHKEVVIEALKGVLVVLGYLSARALAAWLMVAWPVLAGYAIFRGLIEIFKTIKEHVGTASAILAVMFGVAVVGRIMTMVGAVKGLANATWGLAAANKAAAAANPGGTMLGTGAPGQAPGTGGKIGGLARNLGQGLPYIGAAVVGNDLLDKAHDALPEGFWSKVGSVVKWAALGPVALPKYALGKAYDYATSSNKPDGGASTVINVNVAPAKVDIMTADAQGTATAWQASFAETLALTMQLTDRHLKGNR